MLKRIISLLLCVVMLTSVFASCNDGGEQDYETTTSEQTQQSTLGTTYDQTEATVEATDAPQQHIHTPADAVTENWIDSTCKAEGGYDEVVYCSSCNEEISRTQNTIDKKPHEYKEQVATSAYLKIEATCTESAVYFYSCSCGDKGTETFKSGDANKHDFGEWEVTTEPTESAKGEKRRDCKKCEHYETETVAELTHDHSRWPTVTLDAVAPGCTQTGLTEGVKCSKCGETLIAQQTVSAKGHNYKSVVTAPNCTEEGYTTYTCTCGDSYIADKVGALGHAYASEWEKDDTYHWHKTTCGHTDVTSEKIVHNYGTDNVCDDCGYDREIYATGVVLNVNNISMIVGDVQALVATIQPENTTNKQLTWETSNSAAVTVVNGTVTAVGAGTAKITVTTANGKTVTCTVTVSILASGVALNKNTLTLINGTTQTLTATVTPSDTTDKTLSWTSSNESVATVANGTVTAVGVGTATITVTTSNGKTAACAVTVDPMIDVTSITLNKTEATINLGESLNLVATILPENATYKAITWHSSNKNVAKVVDGVVSTLGTGTVTITATAANGKTAQCVITIEREPYLVALTNQGASRLEVYDISGGKLDESSLVWSYETPKYNIAGVKFRHSEAYGDVALMAYGKKYARMVSYPEGELLWSTSKAADNPHSIELLPNGVIAIASSDGGEIRFFVPSGSSSGNYVASVTLADAHGVLWDDERQVLWAIGRRVLTAYRITLNSEGNVSVVEDSSCRAMIPTDYAHDLAPVYGNTNLLWISTGSSVYQFNKTTKSFSTAYNGASSVNRVGVKGIGSFNDGSMVYIYPDGAFKTWTSQSMVLMTNTGGILTSTVLKSETGHFYKVRVWDTRYQ